MFRIVIFVLALMLGSAAGAVAQTVGPICLHAAEFGFEGIDLLIFATPVGGVTRFGQLLSLTATESVFGSALAGAASVTRDDGTISFSLFRVTSPDINFPTLLRTYTGLLNAQLSGPGTCTDFSSDPRRSPACGIRTALTWSRTTCPTP